MRKYVTLGNVCKKGSSNIAQKDIENSNGTYAIYGASGYIKDVNFYHQDKPYIAVVKDGAGIGRTMLLPEKTSVIGTLQYLIPNDSISVKYLYYAVTYMNLSKYFTGATIPHIYFKDYQKELLPLPPMEKQQEIAGNLEKIDTMIGLCNSIMERMNILVKSRFVEMFGDPRQNDKQFETIIGENFFKLSNGKTISAKKRKQTGIPAYGGNGISWYTDDVLFEKDTLVVGRVGFQSGNVHLAYAPLWVTDNAMYISKFHVDEYDLIFLCALMEHINFTRFQDAGDLKKITQKPFMQMEYIFPPMEMQYRYSDFVHQIDKSKLAVKECLEKAEYLKSALMQEYFG